MTIESIVALIILFGIVSILLSFYFLFKGLKENKILHTALAGNAFIVTSTILALCYVMLL